jgi:hypothetical protein
MKKKIFTVSKLLPFMFVWLLGLTGCSEHCPEFDKEILSWFPFQENDMIELYSELSDSTITFLIKTVVVTHKTQIKFGSKCGGCDDDIEINSDDANFRVSVNLYEGKVENQTYKVGDTNFTNYSERNKYLFENKEYDIVRIFEKTDLKGTYQKLIIAKDIGIIGLIDVEGNTWTLKTSAKIRRLYELGKIVINNVSC